MVFLGFNKSSKLFLISLFTHAISAMCLTSCLPSYLVKSGYNQMQILNAREPIKDVLKRNDLPPEQRRKLEFALEVREFAEKNLKLNATENYKTYVDLKRPYVSWIASAAKKDELTTHTYWYPIVGNLPYKGFFTKEEAEAEAANLASDGYDTMVRGVTAYSTLGWFDDPLLSSMLDYEDHGIANVIIHESTHATLYIKSQAEFNERLATFVGNIGTEIFYRNREGANSPTLKQIADENADENEFSKFISEKNKNLKEWYLSQKKPIEEPARQGQFELIQKQFTDNVAPRLKTKSYLRFSKAKLNNAILLYYQTYDYDLSDFAKLYSYFKQDFIEFIKYCRTLEKSSDPNQELKNFLLNHQPAPQTATNPMPTILKSTTAPSHADPPQ